MSTAGHLSSDVRHLSSEDDEEAAEQLRRLLAFGPRIRRGAGGGPDPRLREAGTGTRPVPRVRTTGGGDGCRRDAPFSSRGMTALVYLLTGDPFAWLRGHPRPTGSAMKRVGS